MPSSVANITRLVVTRISRLCHSNLAICVYLGVKLNEIERVHQKHVSSGFSLEKSSQPKGSSPWLQNVGFLSVAPLKWMYPIWLWMAMSMFIGFIWVHKVETPLKRHILGHLPFNSCALKYPTFCSSGSLQSKRLSIVHAYFLKTLASLSIYYMLNLIWNNLCITYTQAIDSTYFELCHREVWRSKVDLYRQNLEGLKIHQRSSQGIWRICLLYA